MKRKLERVKGLDEVVLKKISPISTVEQLLQKSVVELVQSSGITETAAQVLLKRVSEEVAPKCIALDKISFENYLPTDLIVLDEQLKGGLPARSMTELVGPAGSGKTQFCHMLAVQATLPRKYGGLGKDNWSNNILMNVKFLK